MTDTEDSDLELDLDISWIREQERIQDIHKDVSKEKMTKMCVYFLYINKNHYIEKISKEIVHLHSVEGIKGSVLSKETVLRLIQTHKINTHVSRYKFQEVLQFVLSIEPEYLQSFAFGDEMDSDESSLLKSVPFHQNDIVFPESVFIFHQTNTLFFVYQEVDMHSHRQTIKSILKSNHTEDGITTKKGENRSTKKVKIVAKSRTTHKIHESKT
jgi:hypothetical protein